MKVFATLSNLSNIVQILYRINIHDFISFCEIEKVLSIEHHKTKNCLEEEIRTRAKTKAEIKSIS